MADKIMLATFFVWILSIICIVKCWDLKPLEPVSCPEDSQEDGICYKMLHHQVRCLNLTFGQCPELSHSGHSFHVPSGRCLRVSNGYCTKYSCQRTCCADFYTEDYGECENPYCDKHCENGGTCVWSMKGDQKEQKCACSGPFFGYTCQYVKCDEDCQNGGTCVVDGSDTVCSCPNGYFGKTCGYSEKDLSYSCPKPNRTDCCGPHRHCRDECYHDNECYGDAKCCHDGCCRKCIRPVFCVHNNTRYRPGDYITDECNECHCLVTGKMDCNWFKCPIITCNNGEQPVSKDGACCPTCPGDGTRIQFENCQDGDVKHLAVRQYTNTGFLDDLQIRATYGGGNDIPVTYSEDHFKHCKCTLNYRHKHYVTATARDIYQGGVNTCGFWVIITDPYGPEYNSCPADIFAQKGETIEWNTPRANDNVGIDYQSCDKVDGREFSTGSHTVTCTAADYDNNKAYCQFTIYVYDSENGESTMPPGLKPRQKKGINSAYVIAVTFSVVFIIIIVVFIGCLIYRQRKARNSGQRNGGSTRVPTISGHMAVADSGKPAEFILPPYTPKYEPPSYEEIHYELRQPTYESATETSYHGGEMRLGILNAAYTTSEAVIGQQNTRIDESSNDIYEEICLNE